MLLTVLSGLIFSLVLVFFGRQFKAKWSILLPILPTLLFLYSAYQIPLISSGSTLVQQINWVPSLCINFNFNLDGLSLLFAVLITGIGACIFFYGRAYLKGHAYFDRFFGYLDRKSTRLNSSHVKISYAVFCLKKKKTSLQ